MSKDKTKLKEISQADDYAKSIYFIIKKEMLDFAKTLEKAKSSFLSEFSTFLKNEYNTDRKAEHPDNAWQMRILDNFLSRIFLTTIVRKIGDQNGCALLGNSKIDKLQIVKTFLMNMGYKEYSKNSKVENVFIVINCEGKAKKEITMWNYAEKYKDIPFVIFDNCENILSKEDNLRFFKKICENRLTPLNHHVESWYILLGNENKLYELKEKAQREGLGNLEYRISTFRSFIDIYNIDEKPEPLTQELIEFIENIKKEAKKEFYKLEPI